MQAANVSDNLQLFQRKFLFLYFTRYLSIMISHYPQLFHSIELSTSLVFNCSYRSSNKLQEHPVAQVS